MLSIHLNMRQSLVIDWLQLNCGGGLYLPTAFTSVLLGYQTRQFAEIREIYSKDKLICTIANNPHSSIIPKDTHIVKFDNRYLYEGNIFGNAMQLMDKLQLKIKGISRLDIALDVQRFNNNLKPHSLISGFLSNKYLKMGKAKYKLIGTQDDKHVFETLRFGGNISNVAVYLYNKSKELQDVKMKPYIVEKWKADGYDNKEDVWRLEISIKTNRANIINTSTGDVNKLTFQNCQKDSFINDVYYTFISQYFHFKHNDGSVNKSRMKSVNLLSEVRYDSLVRFLSEEVDSGRSDRIFLKHLEEYNCELRERDFELSTFVSSSISDFVRTRGLSAYYQKIAG